MIMVVGMAAVSGEGDCQSVAMEAEIAGRIAVGLGSKQG